VRQSPASQNVNTKAEEAMPLKDFTRLLVRIQQTEKTSYML
jgi:hypothetical protein